MGNRKNINLELILNTAARLAEEQGFENVTLSQIADRLGVKAPSLYNHIESANALSADLAKHALSRLTDVVRDAAVGKSGEAALREIALAYRRFAKENPELYKAILKIPESGDSGMWEEGLGIVRILRRVLDFRQLSTEDTVHFVRGFRSAMHGFVSLEEAGFFRGSVDAEASYERLTETMISSLREKE